MHQIEEIIEDIRQGKMVIMMDDEDRENEGDIIMAAEKVTPEHINFMVRHGRGLVCLPLLKERCEALKLPLMVADNTSKLLTNFTVSIEAAKGITTGISAQDRAHTILTAVHPEAKPENIAQPGHIFPLMAQPGGVLVRAGHTEASVDLARLAGLNPSAVICEILNEDGTMARKPQLEVFAKKHNLKLGTIADLIRYRLKIEPTLKEVARVPFPTRFGRFNCVTFEDLITRQTHFALVCGEPRKEKSAWVRVHLHDPLLDIPGMHLNIQDRWPLDAAISWIAKAQEGAIVILQQPALIPSQLEKKIKALSNPDVNLPSPSEERLIGVGSQILALLGFGKIKLLGAKKHYCALSGFNLEVDEYQPFENNLVDRPNINRSERYGTEIA